MILLTWNRDHEEETWPNYEEYRAVVDDGAGIITSWTVRAGLKVEDGEDCFFFAQGEKHPRGLLARGWISGVVETVPHYDEEAANQGERVGRVAWIIDEMLPKDEPIPLSLLETEAPGIKWRNVYFSGFGVPSEEQDSLVSIWDRELDARTNKF